MALQLLSGNDIVRMLRSEAHMASAYYDLNPYPGFGFKDWDTTKRGPHPKCRPYTQHIVEQQAKYLMGKGIHLKVEGDEKLTKWLNDTWIRSKMQALGKEMAVKGGNAGSVTLVWAYNEDSRNPWQIRVMDPFDEGLVTMAADDPWKAERLRIFKPLKEGNAVMVQIIDWTDETETIYKPVSPGTAMTGAIGIGEAFDLWFTSTEAKLEVQEEKPNAFGIVPAWTIQNRASLLPWGRGDLWTLFKHIDQLNLTADLGYKHSQTEVYPRTVYLDVDAANNESLKNASPQTMEVLDTAEGSPHQGKVENLTTQLEIRQYISGDLDEFRATLYEAAGSVLIRPDMVSNKGNMTTAVIELLFAPLFETIAEKRQTYGNVGICEFFRRMIQGANTMKAGSVPKLPDDQDVEIVWPNMIRQAEEDLMALDQRKAFEVASGYTTQERAVRDVATANGVQDVDQLITDLGPAAREAPAASENAEETNGKPNSKPASGGK